MRLLIVRHADAGDPGEFAATGRPDSERPLSEKGRRQAHAVAKILHELVPGCTLVVSSPFARAAQTAELLAEAWPGSVVELDAVMEPGAGGERIAARFDTKRDADVVALVGHEPDLGHLATWFMTGAAVSRIEFKKAGAALLEFPGRPRRGEAVLRWLMGPKQLTTLA